MVFPSPPFLPPTHEFMDVSAWVPLTFSLHVNCLKKGAGQFLKSEKARLKKIGNQQLA